MREILFRGKREDNSQWIIGFLSKTRGLDNKLHICIDYEEKGLMCSSIVVPSTVGQYTGLNDNKDIKIFEGDIVKSCEYDDIYTIKYFDVDNYPAFDCVPEVPLCECNGLAFLVNTEGCEIIGNIYDNPELLKEVSRNDR